MTTNRELFPAHYDELLNALPDSIPMAAREAIAERNAVYWYDSKWELYPVADFLKGRAERETAEHGKDWRHVPSISEAFQYRMEQFRKTHGKEMDPADKISLHRTLKEATSEELLQVMPSGGKGAVASAESAEKKEQPVTKKFADMTDLELRAVAAERLGIDATTITVARFKAFKEALLKQDGAAQSVGDKQTLARAAVSKMDGQRPQSAVERMESHRAMQRAQGKRV